MSKLLDFFSKRKKTAATGAVVLGLLGTSVGAGVIVSGTPVVVGSDTANIWVDSNGGTCVDNASLTAYVDADACSTFDAANDTCDNGDIVYVKTASAYAGETLSGTNGRTSACTIEPEPDTADIQFSSDFTFGVSDGNGPDWLTIRHVQCGSDPTAFQNSVDLLVWANSNDLTFDDWDCPSFDFFGASRVLIENSDWGPCGSLTDKCVPRIAMGSTSGVDVIPTDVTIEDSNIHDIWCGGGDASACAARHTDGLAVFGSDNLTLRRVKFWKNDITNIRFQNNTSTGTPNTDVLIENNWFGGPCTTTTPTNCTGGINANAFDIDNEAANFTLRFTSFQNQTRPQCSDLPSAGTDCGTAANPAVFLGNIYSVNASFCGYTQVTRSYNAENGWGAYGGPACSGTGNVFGTFPDYVTPTGIVDFHLDAAGIADDLVASGCIATDIDLAARAGSNCDAGSDER
jgi:hypothetical protein